MLSASAFRLSELVWLPRLKKRNRSCRGFFDKEVYNILNGDTTAAENPSSVMAPDLALALTPTPAAHDVDDGGGSPKKVEPALDADTEMAFPAPIPILGNRSMKLNIDLTIGHVDGKSSDARFYHPKGVTMDDKGNVYVADIMNLAIRKIGDAGVTTIAGGKSNVAGYRDGPSEDAKFSNDFDVVYVGPTCSLFLVPCGIQFVTAQLPLLELMDCGMTICDPDSQNPPSIKILTVKFQMY
ncbi:hypothetical protein F3Y22_tig00111840pilonHSYRG00004 [Hibiscus syriacus]|uniref:NHL domain-containing protein n=1 Tax=Hibiscus syriacus TaxID=106335 RepID=A0A6A2YFR2_HIBSY|nr:hypothetical protein F3Y22_tig00111840pilonHSYRG00004 [Hibiscus syriacus]